MAIEEIAKLRPLSEWHAQSLRITAFHKSFEAIENLSWQDITGKLPANQIRKPIEQATEEEGELLGNNLLLLNKPYRIDLILQILNIPILGKGIPSLGLYEELISIFIDLGKKLFMLGDFPSITRLAFGAIVHLNVKNRETGYALMNSYLKNVKVNSDNSSDFMYRINHPKSIDIESTKVKVNRLCKWIIPKYQWIGPNGTDVKSPESYGLQIELDISTDKEYPETLPKDKEEEILEKLTELASEIILEGEPK
ncbi:MAG: hypothetical protein JW787_17210 [Sedimentisphaerales bacterium]|nr:hypothetical protein [Sedimentisphaerales bacterium]